MTVMAHGKGENTKAGEAVQVEESARKNILKKTRRSEAGEHGQVQCRPHPPACFSTVSQGLPFQEKKSLLELISS